jgi:hypothetical protein
VTLRRATRLVIVGVTVLVILVALLVQLSRSSGSHRPGCAPHLTTCVSPTAGYH